MSHRVVLSLLAALAAVPSAHAAVGDNVVVSRADGPNGAKGTPSEGSFNPSLSQTGRYVAFLAEYPFDPANDKDTTSADVYLRDVQGGSTQLVDRATGAGGAKASTAGYPSISADGRKVAFTSGPGLDPALTSDFNHVYLRDVDTQTTEAVDRASASAGGAGGNRGSLRPRVSATGRYVCFESSSTNLDPATPNTGVQIYLRDRQTSTTTVVSRAGGATGAVGDGVSDSCGISDDGRYVAFRSQAANLSPDDTDTTADVYVRDTRAGTTTLVSRADGASGAKANGPVSLQALSGDGRHVLMLATAANLGPSGLYVRDLDAQTTALASRATGDGAADNGSFYGATISGDGRYVAWATTADNLSPEDTDTSISDVYWRDMRDKVTKLASRAAGENGAKGTYGSQAPSLSRDGAFLGFFTSADNLTPEDTDVYEDVIERQMTVPPATQPTTPPATTPPSTTPTAPLELTCSGRRLTILDIARSGERLRVAGVALTTLAGRTVTVRRGKRTLGSGKVRPDGRFTVTATRPTGSGHVRILAAIGSARSQALSIERRFVVLGRKVKGSRLLLSMRFDGPVRGGKVRLVRRVTCKSTARVQSVEVGRKGTFTLSVPLPSAAQGLVFYRVLAPLRHAASYTLPIAVSPAG